MSSFRPFLACNRFALSWFAICSLPAASAPQTVLLPESTDRTKPEENWNFKRRASDRHRVNKPFQSNCHCAAVSSR